MPKGTGNALVSALVQIRPNLRAVIERIEGVVRQYAISDSLAGQTMAMQRDATISAVRMAGMVGSVFTQWIARPNRLPMRRSRRLISVESPERVRTAKSIMMPV